VWARGQSCPAGGGALQCPMPPVPSGCLAPPMHASHGSPGHPQGRPGRPSRAGHAGAPLYMASGSVVFSPSRYAGVGAAGDTRKSKRCSAAPISLWMSVRTCT
jgi:hypothetical protein